MAYHNTYILANKIERYHCPHSYANVRQTSSSQNTITPSHEFLPSRSTNDVLSVLAFVARSSDLHSLILSPFFLAFFSASAKFLCWLHVNIWVLSRAYVFTQCSTTKSRINILYLFGWLCDVRECACWYWVFRIRPNGMPASCRVLFLRLLPSRFFLVQFQRKKSADNISI